MRRGALLALLLLLLLIQGISTARASIFADIHSPRDIDFHSPSGTIFGSRLVAKRQVVGTDIEIGLLEEAIPSAVKPAKILPVNFQSYIGSGEGLPVLCLDQEEKAIVCEMSPFSDDAAMLNCRIPQTAFRNTFNEAIVVHDSGNPRFLIIENEVVLLNCMLGPMSGPSLSYYRALANETMDELCQGYQLQEADFSNYPILQTRSGE